MVRIIDRSASLPAAVTSVAPDLVWQADFESGRFGFADFELATTDETRNRGGLRASDPFTTAVVICLHTDRRRPTGVGSGERGGWFGDAVDLDRSASETELGSLLWTLERAEINDQTGITATAYALEALQPLVAQGLCDYFEVTYELDRQNGRLVLHVGAFRSADAGPVYTTSTTVAGYV